MKRISRWLWTSNAHPKQVHGFTFSRPVTGPAARALVRLYWTSGAATRLPSGFRLHEPVTQNLRCAFKPDAVKTFQGIDVLPFEVIQ